MTTRERIEKLQEYMTPPESWTDEEVLWLCRLALAQEKYIESSVMEPQSTIGVEAWVKTQGEYLTAARDE